MSDEREMPAPFEIEVLDDGASWGLIAVLIGCLCVALACIAVMAVVL